MIRSPLHNQLRQQISFLQGDDFQVFITTLMFYVYGPDGFNTVRPRKDKGADGIIVDKKAVIACWGPEQRTASQLKKAFEKKTLDDFTSYKTHWESLYPNWIVITNHEPAPDQISYVNGLKSGSPIWGLNEIISFISDKLYLADQRKIYGLLGIPKEYVSQDILDGLLENILKAAEMHASIEYKGSAPHVPEKILLNFNKNDADSIEEEYYLLEEEYFFSIQSAMRAFEDGELTKIKRKLICDFNMALGSAFHEKLNSLTVSYLNKYACENDGEYRDVVRALLFWIFSQCLIGEKTEQEKNPKVAV